MNQLGPALHGELTKVNATYWALAVLDPRAHDPWLAPQVFMHLDALESQARLFTGHQIIATKNDAGGVVFLEGPTNAEQLLNFLKQHYPSYASRPIIWALAAPPEPVVYPL